MALPYSRMDSNSSSMNARFGRRVAQQSSSNGATIIIAKANRKPRRCGKSMGSSTMVSISSQEDGCSLFCRLCYETSNRLEEVDSLRNVSGFSGCFATDLQFG